MKSPAPADPRLDRILDFIQDTVADGSFSEPAGRGAGYSVSYDEDSIRAFIAEIFPAPDPYAIKAAISLAMQDERDGKPCGCIVAAGCEARGYGDPDYAADGFLDGAVEAVLQALQPQPSGTAVAPPAPVDNPAEVIGYCWEVNAEHPRLIGKHYEGEGPRVRLGERSLFWNLSQYPFENRNRLGRTQIWIMRNGQEVRATWKEPPAIDPTFRPPLISSPEACWPEVLEDNGKLTRAGETSFANRHTGTREGVAFVSITGKRGDRVVIDDPHSLKGAESEADRETAVRLFLEGRGWVTDRNAPSGGSPCGCDEPDEDAEESE